VKIDRDEEIRRMKTHLEWPAFPFLPLKKYVKGAGWPLTGLLVAVGTRSTTVFNENLFAVPESLSDFKVHKEYPTIEAIVDDDWIVD